MKNISGNWQGNINGTNNADIFIEITQLNQNLSATVRVNDPKYGTSVYRCTGKIKNSKILLKGNPDFNVHNNLEVNLGKITINGTLQKSSIITGKWESSIGTGGVFQVSKVVSTANKSIDMSNEENITFDNTDTRKLNPNWDRVELILTLSLYYQTFPNIPVSDSIEVKILSDLLKNYHVLIGHNITSSLRNLNGIFMKLKNFESLDDRSKNKGLKSVSKLDKEIWNEFLNNQEKLQNLAVLIKSLLNEKNINDLRLINDDGFIEDKLEEFVSRKKSSSEFSIAKGTTDKIVDKHKKPVLNISSVAKVFSKYIINYNSEYTSTIIGIFAKWGRGKTFLFNQIKYFLQKDKTKKVYICEFQPWKYQKAESAWAYLYQKILDNYLKNKKTKTSKDILRYELYLKRKFKRKSFYWNIIKLCIDAIKPSWLWKIFILNKEREGLKSLIISCISIVFISIWIFSPKLDLVNTLVGILGISGLMLSYKTYRFYLSSRQIVTTLVNEYTKTKDYSKYLGFQNEIEKELRHLINVFISEENEQLILFIDDLDRCNEKMIIDIMDSLRLVLEDKEINKKLTIITAVDERILLKSIKHKYFDGEINNEISPKEYIEKFFLIALKLNHLSDEDKKELIKEYTSIFNSDYTISHAVDGIPKIITKIQNDRPLDEFDKGFIKSETDMKKYVQTRKIEIIKDHVKVDDKSKKVEQDIDEDKELEVLKPKEISFISEQVIEFDIDTPRKINMMVQRYLLFKNFVFEEFGYEKEFDYRLLIYLIFAVLDEEKLTELIEKYSLTDAEEIQFEIKENTFKENREVYIVLLKYAEMVSPF